jgi:hypothetical protein
LKVVSAPRALTVSALNQCGSNAFAAISFRYTQARLYTLQPKFLRDSRGPSGSEQPSGIIIDALAGRCGRAADEQRSLQHVRLQFAQREVAIWRQTDNRTLTIQIYKPNTLLLVIPELTDQLNYGQARTKPAPQLMDACKAYLQAASLT